jgi:ubiquitin-like-conjugating enzyme ATG3
MSFLHKLHSAAHAVGEMLLPPLAASAFLERGVLTPEEFVVAGDQLVRTCPTWEWSGGDAGKRRKYLPADKQFLITRGVACEQRVRGLEANYSAEVEVAGVSASGEAAGGDDTWLATHNNRVGGGGEDEEDDEPLDLRSLATGQSRAASATSPAATTAAAATPAPAPAAALAAAAARAPARAPAPPGAPVSQAAAAKNAEDDDGFIDVDEFEEHGLEDASVSAAVPRSVKTAAAASAAPVSPSAAPGSSVLQMRTYDLSITYDNYYQTPRVWLYGYDEQQRPLTGDEVLEDIMQDYANKTVTIEPHPHLAGGVSYASIHPCRHAEVMKKIVGTLTEGGKKAEPSQYLFIFLKFIQSVVPTMNYDTTIEVETAKAPPA